MTVSLTQTFNRESIDPTRDPILLGTREQDGVKQYIIHEYNGWLSGDDVEYYSEEQYCQKFGENDPITLERFQSEFEMIDAERKSLLMAAVGDLDDQGFDHEVEPGETDFDYIESKLIGFLNVMYAEGSFPKEMVENLEAKMKKASDLKEQYNDMKERLEEIGQDTKDKGQAAPALAVEFRQ